MPAECSMALSRRAAGGGVVIGDSNYRIALIDLVVDESSYGFKVYYGLRFSSLPSSLVGISDGI
jgi:hypothetical protein